jgi:DNA-binding NarL/FixJ family response regulator
MSVDPSRSSQLKVSVAVVSRFPLVRRGLRALIESSETMLWLRETSALDEMRAILGDAAPDIVMLHLDSETTSVKEDLEAISRWSSRIKVLVLGGDEQEREIYLSLHHGARGYLERTTQEGEILEALRVVAGGDYWIPATIAAKLATHVRRAPITEADKHLLRLLCRCQNEATLAREMGLGRRAARNLLKELYAKLAADSQTAAVLAALRLGYLSLSEAFMASV